MTPAAIRAYVEGAFLDVSVTANDWGTFFLVRPDEKFPFVTIVDRDDPYDNLSRLDREGVFRLNIGLGRETFRAMFGPPAQVMAKGHDFAALDVLIPHPVYHRQYFVSVLNPSPATFERLKPLIIEAHDIAARRLARGAGWRDGE
jgi:hypothetical protein